MSTPAASPLPERKTLVTRRGVVRTAAWSVPAITLVSAAPAFAVSSEATDDLFLGPDGRFRQGLPSTTTEEGEVIPGIPDSFRGSILLATYPADGGATSVNASPPVTLLVALTGPWPAGTALTLTPDADTTDWQVIPSAAQRSSSAAAVTTDGAFQVWHPGGLVREDGGAGEARLEFTITSDAPTDPAWETGGQLIVTVVTEIELPYSVSNGGVFTHPFSRFGDIS